MPAPTSPVVRQLRRLASAYGEIPGQSPTVPEEILAVAGARRDPGRTISRRELLRRGAGVGVGILGASAPGWTRAPRARAGEASVAIVGAGLAGLSCAYRLSHNGVPTTVYEAQDRVGGRCWTIRLFENDQTAEHGGQYVDSRHRQLRHLASDLGVELIDTWEQDLPSGDHSYLWLDGRLRNPDRVHADFGAFYRTLRHEYERVGPYTYDLAGPAARRMDCMTVVEWLDEHLDGGSGSLLGQAIERAHTSFFGLDGTELSAINLFEIYVAPYPGADERYRIADGNDVLVGRLAEELPAGTIVLERPLEAAWSRSDGRVGLRFTGQPTDVVADVVVFALPFTILRQLDLTGLDLSPRRRRAIEQLAMGTNAKLHLQLNRPLAELGWTGSFGSDEPEFGTWDSTWGQTDPQPETPLITIYTGGAAGAGYPTDEAHGVPSPEIVTSALDALARGVDGIHDASNGLAYLDSWVDDPWVRGSYAAFGPGQYTAFWTYLGTPEGRLVFAGEHTSTHSQGYLNGGVESGLRAAGQVRDELGI